MNYKYTIIVPIYNVEKYLDQCINSLINQTYDNYEVILVDDGSKDKSGQICDHYAEYNKKIKVVHKDNGGIVSARKKGVYEATGDYICCVDGDDWVEIDYLEKINNALQKESYDVVYFGSNKVIQGNKNANPPKELAKAYSKKEIQQEIFPYLIEGIHGEGLSPALWNKAFRKELYVKYQLIVPDKIIIGEDGACVKPIIYNANSLVIINDCIYNYRINNASVTQKKSVYDCEVPKMIYDLFIEEFGEDEQMKEQMYRKFTHSLFNVCVSIFNSSESYKAQKEKIKRLITRPDYREIIDKTKFVGLKGYIIKYFLQYKLYSLMWLYNKYRYR